MCVCVFLFAGGGGGEGGVVGCLDGAVLFSHHKQVGCHFNVPRDPLGGAHGLNLQGV